MIPEFNDAGLLILDTSIQTRELPPFEYRLVSARMARKVFGGDILCAFEGSVAEQEVLEFFQTTRGGIRQGIVEIEL